MSFQFGRVNLLYSRMDDYGYIRWAQDVKKRDHYTCYICGRKGVALHSHHLNAWADYPEQRYDVSNGVTLCTFHHEDFHEKYGKGKNTEKQFEEYRLIAEAFIKVANGDAVVSSASKRMLQHAQRDDVVKFILQDMETRFGSNDESNIE